MRMATSRTGFRQHEHAHRRSVPVRLGRAWLVRVGNQYLLTQKFCYHSTFYREQWKLDAAHGIDLTRNVMCGWHDHLAERLFPLYGLIADKFRASNYIQVDETPIKCLEPGEGKTGTGYLLHALLGLELQEDLRGHPVFGASWEGFALEAVLRRRLKRTYCHARELNLQWVEILQSRSRGEVAGMLRDPSEEMDQLRACAPFVPSDDHR